LFCAAVVRIISRFSKQNQQWSACFLFADDIMLIAKSKLFEIPAFFPQLLE